MYLHVPSKNINNPCMSQQAIKSESTKHSRWVKVSHWIITLSFFALVFTGSEMTMVHPRFYWGEAG